MERRSEARAGGRLLALVCVAVLLGVAAPRAVSYIGFEQLAVAGTSVGFTALKVEPDGSGGGRQATLATCRVRTAEISFTIDGTTPTASVGTLAEIGDYIVINGHDSIMRFRSIRTTGTSGQADCTFTQP